MDTFASCFFSCKELGLKALKDNPVVSVKDFISVLATPPYLVPPEKGGAKGRSVDANQFLTDQHLVGTYICVKYSHKQLLLSCCNKFTIPTMSSNMLLFCMHMSRKYRNERVNTLGLGVSMVSLT